MDREDAAVGCLAIGAGAAGVFVTLILAWFVAPEILAGLGYPRGDAQGLGFRCFFYGLLATPLGGLYWGRWAVGWRLGVAIIGYLAGFSLFLVLCVSV
jgi:hypothetical protein